MGSNGSRFAVETPWGGAKIALCLLGRFNVSNALAVVASCGALGIAPGQVAEVIARVRNIPGRLEEIPTRMGFLVFVDYAHTDDALSNVLRTLRELTRRRLIVVFGCGGNRDRTKRPAMGAVAAELADFSVLTSDNPRRENPSDILAQVRQGFGERANFEIVEDRAEAIQRALSMAAEGDVVLIAGKGHETYQEFAHTVIPFDDREIARKILAVLSP
jgi:UDP-N-acetylmuramoyl-L-alanyl-D-glutamate--2,6-diaminopimelate ligase